MNLANIISFLLLSLLPMSILAQKTNIEESKVPYFDLPEILVMENGQEVKTIADWEKDRRPELLQVFESQMFGKSTTQLINIEHRTKILNKQALNGKATLKEIRFIFSGNKKSHEAILLVYLPNSTPGPVPVFLGYNFDGNHTIFPDELISLQTGWTRKNPLFGMTADKATPISRGAKTSRWPVLNIINRGYGLATMFYGDIDPDFDDGFQNGIHALIEKSSKKQMEGNDWGSLATWAWGLSKVLDYFEEDAAIDAKKVAVIGHSRLGKAALWAGAMDQRFAMIISNNSGCGGAAISKRRFGETVQIINNNFPHWFCDNFNQYNNQEPTIPFDQHMLIALAAPRPIYIASATEDTWADPKGEFLSGKYASVVYQLYGLTGLDSVLQPPVNQPVKNGHIGYHVRSGKHNLTIYDWEQYLDFADLHLKAQ